MWIKMGKFGNTSDLGNVSDVLLKFYYIKNQHNTNGSAHHREKSFLSL